MWVGRRACCIRMYRAAHCWNGRIFFSWEPRVPCSRVGGHFVPAFVPYLGTVRICSDGTLLALNDRTHLPIYIRTLPDTILCSTRILLLNRWRRRGVAIALDDVLYSVNIIRRRRHQATW